MVEKKLEEIKKVVLEYLYNNRDAGGTLEDIALYWMKLQIMETSIDEVAKALAELVGEHRVDKIVPERRKERRKFGDWDGMDEEGGKKTTLYKLLAKPKLVKG